MNRAERRSAKFKRGRRMGERLNRGAMASQSLSVLSNSRPYEEGELTDMHLKTRSCFERLKDGTADKDDYDRVAMAMNLAKIRAMDIDEALADEIEMAQDAMKDCKTRYFQTQKLQLDQEGIEIVSICMDHYEAIADASSPQQMVDATKTSAAVIRRQLSSVPGLFAIEKMFGAPK